MCLPRHPFQCRIVLKVRNKHPEGMQAVSADRVLIYVHGATYPAETAFDLPVGGASMMDILASQGWDVWMLDVRGYSRSTRPPEMDQAGSGQQANRGHRDGSSGRRLGGRVCHETASSGQGELNGLVVGHVHHGAVHHDA